MCPIKRLIEHWKATQDDHVTFSAEEERGKGTSSSSGGALVFSYAAVRISNLVVYLRFQSVENNENVLQTSFRFWKSIQKYIFKYIVFKRDYMFDVQCGRTLRLSGAAGARHACCVLYVIFMRSPATTTQALMSAVHNTLLWFIFNLVEDS